MTFSEKKKQPSTPTQNQIKNKQQNTKQTKKPPLPKSPPNPHIVSTTEHFECKPTCCKPNLHLEVKTVKVSLFYNAVCLNCAV